MTAQRLRERTGSATHAARADTSPETVLMDPQTEPEEEHASGAAKVTTMRVIVPRVAVLEVATRGT